MPAIEPEVMKAPIIDPAVVDELEKSENLVVRQAHALVISSDDDYAAAGEFLNKVIVAGRNQVHEVFDDDVAYAHQGHQRALAKRARYLEPWESAEALVKKARVDYYQQAEAKRKAEQQAREAAARKLEEDRRRQEAEAERQRAEEEAKRRREEADRRRVEAEAEAEKMRNKAAEEATESARLEGERKAKELEEQAARDAKAAEESAAAIAEAGEAAAAAIEAEPIHLELPSLPGKKLGGVAKAWGVNDKEWDREAFALFIAEDPKGRAKYIGAPAWSLLREEAKQQKSQFRVGGIQAGEKYSGRTGK